VSDRVLHNIGQKWFGDAYTIEKRKFADKDERWIVKHSIGYSSRDYVTIELWATLGEVVVKTIENDRETHRARYTVDLQERII